MIVPKYYEDLKIVHENTMPYRAYYIPASHYMGSLTEDRFFSDRIMALNGTWQFSISAVFMMCRKNFMNRIMTAAVLVRWRCRESGRITDMTATSIPT